ncbi:MAG: LamG-like jellyroll fold domain-containing protein, partial [Candidatus Hodarchaeota archaeon]
TIYGATWIPGVSGTALDFNGMSDYVEIGDSGSLDVTQEITIEVWIKAGTNPYQYIRNSTYVLDKTSSYALWYSPNGIENTTTDQFFFDLGDGQGCSTTQVTWQENTWYYLVGTYNGSVAAVYVNGTLNNATSFAKSLTTSVSSLTIGKGYRANSYWQGAIDEVFIYNRALNATEIQTRYYMHKLVASWHFDEDTSFVAGDSSVYGNDGTIYGATWIPGVSGTALNFDGIDDYVKVVDSTSLDVSQNLTVEAWVKFSQDPYSFADERRIYILDKCCAYRLWYSADGVGASDPDQFFFDLSDWQGCVTTEIIWKPHIWYHLVCTYNGSVAAIYVNGELNNAV